MTPCKPASTTLLTAGPARLRRMAGCNRARALTDVMDALRHLMRA